MRNRLGTLVGLALALVVLHSVPAGADSRRRQLPTDPLLLAETFSQSGPCSGIFDGYVWVDGVRFRMAPDALVYEPGRGILPGGTSLADRIVCVSGLKLGHTLVAYTLLVRPAYDPGAAASVAGPVGVQRGSRPQ